MAVTGADAARETSSVRNLSDHLRGRANSSSSRLWSAKIARVRTEVEVGQFSSQRALARTLFSAYSLGLNSEYLSEALIILRDLHGRALDENLAQDTLDLGEALFAEYRRTGQVKHLEDMLAIHARVSTHRLLRTSLDCQHARALIARGVCVQEHGDLQRAKELISTIEPRLTDSSSSEFLVACNIYHGTTWRDHNPHNLEQLRLILDQSTDQLNRHGLVRWRSEVLGCCFLVCNAICSVGGNPDEMECTILTELNDDALQTRAKSVMDPSDMLCSLTLLYLNLGSRHAEAFYIAKAREWVERISHTLTDQSMDPTETLHSLGMCLYVARSWLILGDNVVFEDTITHYRKAIGHSPYPHAIRHQYLLGLSLSLFMLFQYTGSMSALNEGTALSQNYRDIASTSPPLAIVLARLLSERVQAGRLRNASKHGLLQRAIQVLQSALAHTRSGSVHHSPLLQQLSSLYQLQGDLGLSPDRAEHLAIVRIRSSLPFKGDLPEQLQTKLDLIHALLELAREAKDQTALQEATLLLTDINKTSGVIAWHGESIRPDLELLHGSSHIIRGILSGTTVEPATIAEMFVSSNGDISGSTIDHLSRCLKWARLARAAVDHTLEMQAYRHAIGLLPRLAHLGGDISSRLKALHLVEGMATRAAVLALSMDGVCEAIELLEQARGVVWSQSLHPRVSLEAIPQDHVASFTQATESLRMSSDATERRQYAAELEFIIGRIRKVEGYERFLLPCLYQELRACAARGFIVLVIPSDTATHVVVIASPTSSPVHLRLSALKLGRLHSLTANLKSMSDRSRDSEVGEARGMKKVEVPSVKAALRSEYVDVLGELWTELVYPIITSVSLQRSSDRPRLWWCPTGPVAELPIHAAGIYSGRNQDCLANYVVSSYTPTLSALINAQASPMDPIAHSDGDILVVSLPDVTGLPPLPNAEVEASVVQDLVSAANPSALTGERASISSVLTKLPGVSVFHLACHGHQSQDDPLTSGFSLHDGRLTLEQLMQLHLPSAKLAYLSACETASMDEYQPDEAVNLAATMLFVGFKSVVATMWSMDDLDGPFIAERVYRTIFRDGKLNLSAVPHALDAAVRDLRETGAHPSRWATYVHIGA